MWLPEPIYKSLPTMYAAIGVLFILGVLYVGLDAPMAHTYLLLGLVSILASITVMVWRSKHASDRSKVDSDDAPAD